MSKPLQLLAALPRFLPVGDETSGGVLVLNETGSPGTATVDATVAGARLPAAHRRSCSPPAGGRR